MTLPTIHFQVPNVSFRECSLLIYAGVSWWKKSRKSLGIDQTVIKHVHPHPRKKKNAATQKQICSPTFPSNVSCTCLHPRHQRGKSLFTPPKAKGRRRRVSETSCCWSMFLVNSRQFSSGFGNILPEMLPEILILVYDGILISASLKSPYNWVVCYPLYLSNHQPRVKWTRLSCWLFMFGFQFRYNFLKPTVHTWK